MPGFLHVTAADIAAVGPETFLCVVGIALILLDAFAKGLRPSFPYVALAGLAVANFLGGYPPGSAFGGAIEASDLTRFVDLLRRYSDRAQFVVVTHQKRTMEAADVLYGVTMGQDGVSQVVSRRLPQHQHPHEHAAA